MKIYYLTNAPTPYKISFWEELGKTCELTVLLEVGHSKERDSTWKTGNRTNYHEIVLSHILRKRNGALCPSVIKYLNQRDGIYIINGYNTMTGMLSIIYSRIRHIPYFLSADGGMLKREPKFIKFFKACLIKNANGYFSSGEITDEYLKYYGAEADKIIRYPFSSISEKDILKKPVPQGEKRALRKELKISEPFMIISVGQFIHRKGFDVLIRASEQMDKNIGIYIIGGTPTEEYQELIDRFMLTNIHFLPFMPFIELKKYYSASDLFVLPTREDIWGLVVNEAMSFGLPIITTNKCVAGVEMIRKEDCGIIIYPDDVDELNISIRKLLYDNDLRSRMSNTALIRARQYTIEEMARKHYEILSQTWREVYGGSEYQ